MAICIPGFPSVWFQGAGVAISSSIEPSACVRLSISTAVYVCVFTFPCTFRWLRPILSVKLKRKNNCNSNNYNDNKR